MAYNFLCETDIQLDWDKLNKFLIKFDKLEFFPIITSEKERLAVAVVGKNVGVSAFKQFKSVYKKLSNKYYFTVYDMYYGKIVDKEHLKVIKTEIT